MYSLTVTFGPGPTVWRFLFRDKARAEGYNALTSMMPSQDFHIEDDFGQCGDIKAAQIHGRMLENMDESALAYVELALFNARVQAKAQSRAEGDSTINRHMRGPAVLTPNMGGNGRM